MTNEHNIPKLSADGRIFAYEKPSKEQLIKHYQHCIHKYDEELSNIFVARSEEVEHERQLREAAGGTWRGSYIGHYEAMAVEDRIKTLNYRKKVCLAEINKLKEGAHVTKTTY